jgi:hypothetical protein
LTTRAHPWAGCALAVLGLVSVPPRAAFPGDELRVTLGRSAVDLTTPWKFHVGDSSAWSSPSFDDSTWEVVDLTAPVGAHDGDVGLTGYVPGWSARGHRGYSGFAWYRLRILLSHGNEAIGIAGPPAVDSAYQVFANGVLLGGSGDFKGPVPAVFSVQPRLFRLPEPDFGTEERALVIAFRVWMGSWDLGDPSAGGIHIAPVLGDLSSVQLRFEHQWLQTIRGYVVEIVEAVAFLLLATMAFCLHRFDRADPAYPWLAAALVFVALYRTNQAAFFWGQFETVQGFEALSIVLLIPLCLGTWTLAWLYWFRAPTLRWMPSAAIGLTLCFIVGELLTRSWFHGVFPSWLVAVARFAISSSRVLFLALTVFIACRALRLRGSLWALPALLLISTGLFAQEISFFGVRGIWFPFGTGVSRTQFAYAAFDVWMFGLLWSRLMAFAPSRHDR